MPAASSFTRPSAFSASSVTDDVGDFRYLSYELTSGTFVEALPLSGVSFGSVLNGAGSFSASLSLEAANVGRSVYGEGGYGQGSAGGRPSILNPVVADSYITATEPTRQVIYVERDGVLLGGYIIWTRGYDSTSHVLSIGGLELWSIFRSSGDSGRLITDNYNVDLATMSADAAVDQLLVVQDLINYTQAKPGGDLGIVVGTETSGVIRDPFWFGDEFKPIGEAIEQLSELEDGFDFAIDVRYDSNLEPEKLLTLSYPRRGRTAPNTGHVFEYPGNVLAYTWPEDGTKSVNQGWTLGEGDPGVMLIGSHARPDRLDAGYPLLEAAYPYKDEWEQGRLNEHARADVDAYAEPLVTPELVVRADADPVIGSYITGDEARVRITDPLRFPTTRDEYRRILSYTVQPDEGPGGTVTLQLGDI